MIIKGNLSEITDSRIIGFDAEWTKNYKIKNGNVPFCFSVIEINENTLTLHALKKGDIHFKYIQYYCENREEFRELVLFSEAWFSKLLKSLDSCVLCGHQISSDFSVLYNIGKAYDIEPLINLENVRIEWRNRKNVQHKNIIDTRYDIEQEFLGKSRRLVDMCNDFGLDVTQPELKNFSMTKLQNNFYDTHEIDIYERISVMNLRHSLCAVILYWLNKNIDTLGKENNININKSIYKCLRQDFKWINSKEFLNLLDK